MPPAKKLEAHPFADLFPMMSDAEFKDTAADIVNNGLYDKIWLYEGKILDGRNRYKVCLDNDIDPRFEEYKGKDPLGFVISKNLHRRHLSESQRAMVAARLAQAKGGRPTEGKPGGIQPVSPPALTNKEAAEKLKVSESTLKIAKQVQNKGTPAVVAAVDAGEVKLNAAATVAKLPKAEQEKAAAGGAAGIKKAAAQAKAEPVKQSRPMPTQTKPKNGQPAPAGLGGEKFDFSQIERPFGALTRAVDAMATAFNAKSGASHSTALDNLDAVIKHLKTWYNRQLKKDAAE
jgi:hypothetical protein